NQLPANPLDFFRTRNFVASSAAALVSDWAYNPTPPKQSTGVFRKNHLSCIQLFFQRNLHGSSNLACFPDSDRRGEPRET
ncbi:hypothetical protein, partial [Rhizobium sp. BK275]|uniref:hypothetical protein n=1 Tax=Rhizobium sp. BK275 TaxID=2587077 RepID=UPI001AEE2B37